MTERVKEGGALNIVMGVNDHEYQPDTHHLLTAASCTTNCLAPVVKVIHEGIGIRHGVITTIHDITNTQTIIDAPHKDLRRARASSLSLIPTTTSTARATGVKLTRPGVRALSGSSASREKMPPSPRLSARMMKPRYFTVTTIMSDQMMSESTPSTFSRVGATQWGLPTHSWKA